MLNERLKAERRGDKNIVIGGQGEHEVNVLWDMQEAYKHLARTCEYCGGVTRKHNFYTLSVTTTTGEYHLRYSGGRLDSIEKVDYTRVWTSH